MDALLNSSGSLAVITGPMFSGKSEELIRRLTLAKVAHKSVVAYKPAMDNRFSPSEIVSRSGSRISCVPISENFAVEVVKNDDNQDIVAFDEAQFFPLENLTWFIRYVLSTNRNVIVAGLDCDYLDRPFETVASLLAEADFVDKLRAVCTECGAAATKTARLDTTFTERILIGDYEYTALCRSCHYKYLQKLSNLDFLNCWKDLVVHA